MNPCVRFENEAGAEYREAARWYERQRAGLGIEFLDAVDAAITQILEFPRSGPYVRRLPPDLTVRRMPVKRFPYHVVYLESQRNIHVLAIAHDRRKPGYWRHRADG